MAMTIAEQLAREVKGLSFRELPSEVVHQVKRIGILEKNKRVF